MIVAGRAFHCSGSKPTSTFLHLVGSTLATSFIEWIRRDAAGTREQALRSVVVKTGCHCTPVHLTDMGAEAALSVALPR